MRRSVAAVVLLLGCRATPSTPPDAGVTIRHADASPPVDSAPDLQADTAELPAEPRDLDPRSEKVKLKLAITPAATGAVMWGRRKLAELKPGQMTVEIERPRDSGPLDVVIKATGFLPHHVRLFSDRDDRLSVRLYRPEEASSLLGYRRTPVTP